MDTATSFQDPKKTAPCILKTFAISKIGRNFIKECANASKASLRDQATIEELGRCITLMDELPEFSGEKDVQSLSSQVGILISIIGKLHERKSTATTSKCEEAWASFNKKVHEYARKASKQLENATGDAEDMRFLGGPSQSGQAVCGR